MTGYLGNSLRRATFAATVIVAAMAAPVFGHAESHTAATVGRAASAPASPVSATPVSAPAMPGTEAPAMTAADLGAFFDGIVPYAIHRGNIAGAAIAVVADGHLVFAKGYGYADVKTGRPVIADQTLFRPGSVSKTFTWTAVMQLVQEGKLDLDTDVNKYLDFKIPEKFGKPITLRDIMTHSAGFEDTVTDLFVNTPDQLYPLKDYLQRRMPARIYPPGKIVAYSNFATTIAGYIVQRVSGEPFDQYIQKHIFGPLGMGHSTFQQPLPARLKPFMAKGYKEASDKDTVPFEYVEAAPAGALSSTVTDMARFMLAQLDNGSFDGAQILNPATIKEMHTPQGRPIAGMNGMDLGFYDENRNGLRIIGHAGDTNAFHSDMHLLLNKGVGIFMTFNSTGTAGAVEQVRVHIFRAFLDRYFPYTAPKEATVKDPQKDAARVAGSYESSRHTSLPILGALGQSVVTALPNGEVEVSELTKLSEVPKRWREVAPLTYREVGGQTHLKFVTDKAGHIEYWLSDDFIPVEVGLRAHGLEQWSLLKLLGGLFIVIMVLTLAIWIGGAIVRRRFHASLELTRLTARLRLASRLGTVIYLALVGGWLAFFYKLMTMTTNVVGDMLLGWFVPLYALGVLAVIGSLAMIANAGLRLKEGPGGWLARGGELVIGLAALYGIWAIFDLGLATFNTAF